MIGQVARRWVPTKEFASLSVHPRLSCQPVPDHRSRNCEGGGVVSVAPPKSLASLKARSRYAVMGLLTCGIVSSGVAAEQTPVRSSPPPLPVRGLNVMAPAKRDIPTVVRFIRESKDGFNTLVLEFDYNFNFQSRPEFSDPSGLDK